jgi:hypothetical protein
MRRKQFTPHQIDEYGKYCINDVELTYYIAAYLIPLFSTSELKLLHLNIRKFTKPALELDRMVLRNFLNDLKEEREAILKKANIQDVGLLRSNDKFAAILKLLGVTPPTKISPVTGKETYAFAKTDNGMIALQEHEDTAVQAVVAARLNVRSTIAETRAERFLSVARLPMISDSFGRNSLAVPLLYYGAHTGRLSGFDKLNMQNLSRGSKLREAITVPVGKKMVVGDLSQIEARIAACLAGQMDLVRAFANDEDVYCEFATKLYKRPITAADYAERFVGKCTVLSCFSPDTQVLTDSGYKAIVHVSPTDMVWDGYEWVNHEGVICQGEQETLLNNGVRATMDHEILTEHGWVTWSEAHKNPSLFQSALRSVALPSLSGGHTVKRPEKLRAGSQLSDVSVVGKAWCFVKTLLKDVVHNAVPVQGLRPVSVSRITGSTHTSCLMTSIDDDYSLALQRSLTDAETLTIPTGNTMEDEASQSMNHGKQTGARSLPTLLVLKDGLHRTLNWIGWIIVRGMNPATYASVPEKKTTVIEGRSLSCKPKSPVYDVCCAGPRNRFTILSNQGPIIVHNCQYGVGYEKLAASVNANPNVEITLDEAIRTVNTYRNVYFKLPELWKEANGWIEYMTSGAKTPLKYKCLEIHPAYQRGRHEVAPAILLPNGMPIYYPNLHKGADNSFYYTGTRNPHKKIYGAAVLENVCQALARVVLAEAELRMAEAGKYAANQVHDELIYVCDETNAQLFAKALETALTHGVDWMPELPVACEVAIGDNYREAK